MPDLRVLCRGSKANCILQCSVKKQCPTPQPKVTMELNFVYLEKRPGDLGMAFCSGSHPSTRYYPWQYCYQRLDCSKHAQS